MAKIKVIRWEEGGQKEGEEEERWEGEDNSRYDGRYMMRWNKIKLRWDKNGVYKKI